MSRCPSPLRLSRAVSEGKSAALARHLEACASCAREWASLERVIGLARELPDGAPQGWQAKQSTIEELRTALVAQAAAQPKLSPRSNGRVALLLAVAAVAAAGLVLWRWPHQQAGASRALVDHGTVHAREGARFIRLGAAPDEIVRLTQGELTVEVAPLASGQRFRVITGDAEVEVRGTAFDVAADGDRLVSVRVLHGRVEVRPSGAATVMLTPGQRWAPEPKPVTAVAPLAVAPAATPAVTPPPVAPAATPAVALAPPRPHAHPPAAKLEAQAAPDAAVRQPRASEVAFDDGWRALRSGDPETAAAAFARTIASGENDPLAEDARFWAGVALARAKHADRAIAQLESFADRYPSSPRFGEASAMLGWLLVEAGDLGQAERRFRAALDDRVTSVVDSARKGLAAVAQRRVLH